MQYSPILDLRVRKHLHKTNDSRRLDETYLKIKGDSEGKTIDFWLSDHRDKDSARKFHQKALRSDRL